MKTIALLLAACTTFSAQAAETVERVVFQQNGQEQAVEGRLLLTAQDGGVLLMASDGVLWAVPPDQQVSRAAGTKPFTPLSANELSAKLLAELPPGFELYQTTNYLIFHDTSKAYAQWCGSLFERLYLAFTNYWRRRGFEIRPPEFPLVAVVFADRDAYVRYSRDEVGDAIESIIGYYSLRSNQMVMYDLTGSQSAGLASRGGSSAAQINALLRQPAASRQVATIVHEATHQIAFNCGLHTRYSDCPRWFSEGIAVYFETPDLASARGWRGVGELNPDRLAQFRQYLRRRPATSLETLLRDDQRFLDANQALNAYAEAWSLTYFLLHRYPDKYINYLRVLSEKSPLVQDGPERRLLEFREIFGELRDLDAEFVRYVDRLR
ncbi:MAG: DUF1570 domain-containing protein [Patescibacteria group bacterium]|nr:DUF1570 domain-containing protein [Patescibacteria group bacterium]